MGPGDGEPLLLLPPLPAGCDLVVRLSSKCLSETRCFPGTSEVLFLTGCSPMTKCVCCLYACADSWGPRLRWNEWQLFWSCSKSPQKKIHPSAAGDGQLHGRICQEIGPEHAAPVCKGWVQNVAIVTQRRWQGVISNIQFVYTVDFKWLRS